MIRIMLAESYDRNYDEWLDYDFDADYNGNIESFAAFGNSRWELSSEEQEYMNYIDIRGDYDRFHGVTLLSADEAEKLLTQEQRKCKYKGDECAWWLEDPKGTAMVDENGLVCSFEISDRDADSSLFELGVRPVLIHSLGLPVGMWFVFGEKVFTIISGGYALCDEIIT